jgi:alkanesulfonate monooxygenase SsuD/methylene tetrahydromethanopterin reductase-like flavin-dependent oxidoreductase (luciferase family)
MLFGGFAPAALARMARMGDGYIGPSMPAEMVAGSFEQARAAWQKHGRAGQPRLVAICYFALGDPDQGPANVHDYYSFMGDTADMIAGTVRTTHEEVRQAVKDFGDMGADELVFNPATANLDDVATLAEIVF